MHTYPYEVAYPLIASAILTQPLANNFEHFGVQFAQMVLLPSLACLHVPAEDGEDDAGVSGDGEEGDGAEERENWVDRGWRWRGHL